MTAQAAARWTDGDVHVFPQFPDEPEHDVTNSCWCEPEIDYLDPETGVAVWLHKRVQ